MYERITATDPSGPARYGHDFRYRLASGFVNAGDHVLDAACGTGYGSAFLVKQGVGYLGVDRVKPEEIETADFFPGGGIIDWRVEDLSDPSNLLFDIADGVDVFIGFETIEHLPTYYRYIELAKSVQGWIIMSAPVVPTKHINPWHLHDFEPGQLQAMLEGEAWEHYQTVQQPSEVSEIVVMRRR